MAFRVKSPREDAGLNKYRAKEYDYLRSGIMLAWWPINHKPQTDSRLYPVEIVENVNKMLKDDARLEWEISGVITCLLIDGYLEMEFDGFAHRFRPTDKGVKKITKIHEKWKG